MEEVPKMIEDGYKVLWSNLRGNDLRLWCKLRKEALSAAQRAAAEAERLLTRLREREALIERLGSLPEPPPEVATSAASSQESAAAANAGCARAKECLRPIATPARS